MSTRLVDAARRVLRDQRALEDGRDPAVVHLPSTAITELHRAAALELTDTAQQMVVVSNEGLDSSAFEHVIWRECSRLGRRCERIYMIPHAGFLADKLQQQIEADAQAGLSSRHLVVSKLPLDAQLLQSDGLWILDDNTVVTARADNSASGRMPTNWTVSCRESDVRSARGIWDQMWSLAARGIDGRLDLEEPLVLTADLIYGVAPVFCTRDHVDPSSCSWYHGTWQYLRLLQLVSTPTWHHEFYERHLLEAVQATNASRALVTGAADYSMLAYLARAVESANAEPTIHVVDQCATPLFGCRWYAKRFGFDVTTFETDVLEFGQSHQDSYDVICTDAFLTRFSSEATAMVLSTWLNLLRSGGRLVTTVRLHNRAVSVRDSESAIKDFRERAVSRARRWEPFLRHSAVEIGELAEVYARRMISNVLGDEGIVRERFKTSGFQLLTSELGEVPGELLPTVYLRVVCQKP
jgi:SAM-dependent methyltransferase